MRKNLVLLGLLVAVGANLSVAYGAAPAGHRFTFRDAEFMPADRGLLAAQSFVDAQLPPGLALWKARDRLTRADMRCDQPRTPNAPTLCDFSELVHNEGGTIGEDHFTVKIFSREGVLISTQLDHFNIGTGNPNP